MLLYIHIILLIFNFYADAFLQLKKSILAKINAR